MFAGRPIIGILGGIGSGKSFVSGLFGELGACVINADALVHLAYARADVKARLRERWGDAVLNADGTINRRAIAARVFDDAPQRLWLEKLVHPLVYAERDRVMHERSADPAVTAFVWDTPLLVETGGHLRCDALIFVDTAREIRQARVAARGWDAAELARRENLQCPLDKKRQLAHYVLSNAAEAAAAREQVRSVFSLILSDATGRPSAGSTSSDQSGPSVLPASDA